MSDNGVHVTPRTPRPVFPDDLTLDNAIPGHIDPLDLPEPGAGPRLAVSRFYALYAHFSGRASRSEFWWVVAYSAVVWAGLTALGLVIGGTASGIPAFVFVANGIFTLVSLVPAAALTVRRLHDTDRSGLLVFIALVPVVGVIALLVLGARESEPTGERFDRIRPVYPSDLHSQNYIPPAAVGPSAFRALEQNSGPM